MFNYPAKASELVCVAIGVNLLFPATPVILNKLLQTLTTNADKVFRELLGDITFLREHDIQELKILSDQISEERRNCSVNWISWPVTDLIFATIGTLLLWTGFVDLFGGWCILLFFPATVALIQAFLRLHGLESKSKKTFSQIRNRIQVRKDDATLSEGTAEKTNELAALALEIRKFLESHRGENNN